MNRFAVWRTLKIPIIAFVYCIIAFFFCFALNQPGFAWDISIRGDLSTRYTYILRTGPNDIFGNANAAQSLTGTTNTTPPRGNPATPNNPPVTSIGLSGPLNNVVAPEVLSSKGADAAWVEQTLNLYPKITINPAVTVYSTVSLSGSLNGIYSGGPNWVDPPHYGGFRPTSRSSDGNTAIAVPVIRNLWTSMQTPWGLLKTGRYPLSFGLGWATFHESDNNLSLISLSVPYGPFSFFAGHSLANSGDATDPYDQRNRNKGLFSIPGSTDQNKARSWDSIYAITYRAPALEIGALNRIITYHNIHARPQGSNTFRDDRSLSFASLLDGNTLATQGNANTTRRNPDTGALPIYGDVSLIQLSLWSKYESDTNSRRFFVNSEFTQQWLMVQRNGGRPISGTPYAWNIETGIIAGPAKFTLANFYKSGHDRRGNQLDLGSPTGSPTSTSSAQTTGPQFPFVYDQSSEFITLEGSNTAIAPYTWLLGYYGAGNNAYDPSGSPTYTDINAYAARFDYALAANLNVFTTYLYALRASNTATTWAQYTGGLVPSTNTGPNVPDNMVGQEMIVGLSWKLLENVTLDTTAAVLLPGKWWNFAYADYSMTPGGNTNSNNGNNQPGNTTLANPGRSIDSMFGMKSALTVTF